MRIPSLFAALVLLAGCTTSSAPIAAAPAVREARPPVTIVIGVDGARPDYLTPATAPNLSRLAAGGVAGAMRPSFPTKTFPNFWTLATGVRPDKSGIVGNKMEDPARPGETFTMETVDPFWWNAAKPIWIAAEQASIRSATMFWPGSEVAWGGTGKPDHGVYAGGAHASDWQAFSAAVTAGQRVDAVVDWLRRPAATRPRLVMLYFDDVDVAGHDHGRSAPETRAAMHAVDAQIGRLQRELTALGQPANLIVVADHGMAAIAPDRVIAFDGIAPANSYRLIETGPYAAIEPLPGREAALAAALARPHPHMQCWPKAAIPARLRYGTNPRVAAFLCLAEIGWTITPTRPTRAITGGAHGYDDAAPEMQALFVAGGPALRPGVTLPSFRNTAIHPLLRRILGLAPDPALDGDGGIGAAALR
ncbi:ectonucleotide pyrophosphatase/phosphodiesterase [Sphingomonas sp. 2R-10]|uniref:alkaline phosphatase family protein n=1 Tax=Sphingomonas sp. 2R-10 TaxID=3045148 RepID=UPI000F7885A6|nr:ectonucleotide pyrophosphatase/phosphodiesterase [Sphingomonas sp. 2R-10]MDJ0276919.1 ectonucleotide pyrophosphatase/phosphodiesterase [Sphingomonas sp. 2R-10]